MIDLLLLRFDAPLQSFGGVLVDNLGRTEAFPGRSLLAGLIANALGWDHRAAEQTQRLQDRIQHGVRLDRRGVSIVDFQTVDLGQPFLARGWTTAGAAEGRKGGTAATGTHIRHRHYVADAVLTVALTLAPSEERPSLDDVEAALREPERPLFLGRKSCLPAGPILLRRARSESVLRALEQEPLARRRGQDDHQETRRVPARWPAELEGRADSRVVPVTDERDWANQVHAGQRFVREGVVDVEGATDGK